jgi:hypothetical protein
MHFAVFQSKPVPNLFPFSNLDLTISMFGANHEFWQSPLGKRFVLDAETCLAKCNFSSPLDDDSNTMSECYLSMPEILNPTPNPLSFAYTLQTKHLEQYVYKSIDKDLDIICYIHIGNHPNDQ